MVSADTAGRDAMSYGLHRVDKPWQQQEDETDNGDCNELIDSPPNDDEPMHAYVEDLLSGPEPYEPNVYDGTYHEDDGA